MDENNEQFVAYFLPSSETLTKREEDDRDGVSYRPEEEWVCTTERECVGVCVIIVIIFQCTHNTFFCPWMDCLFV